MTFEPVSRLRLAHPICLVLCCLLMLLLSGCPKPVLVDDRPIAPKASPLEEAVTAYLQGNFSRAEATALRLSKDTSLSQADLVEANRILAAAALQTGHPSVALDALDSWRKAAPGVDNGKEWQDAWCKAMRALSSHDARTRANAVYQDASRSALVRSVAGVFLAVRQWQDGELGQSMAALENIHSTAQNAAAKAVLEQRLALELHLAKPAAASLAYSAVTEANQGAFPYSIILVDKLRRDRAKADTREAAEAALLTLQRTITLADPSLFKGPPSESSISIQGRGAAIPSGPVAGQPVVLALPLSGQYAAIAAKIVAGAQAACDELSASGSQVSLVVIDTDQADWIARADGLPKNATIIGGPLRRSDYTKAKAQGLTSRKAVFAFLPGLESGDEGNTAWRFFSSAQDQVDTLLSFTSRLGISGYGIFYPQENFGQRMAELFESRAKSAGAKNVVSQAYSPGDQNNWMAAAGELLAANRSGRTFQAVFLPDSWKNMDLIVPNLFYQNETRQVLLGTSLWEQGLQGAGFVSMQYYNLAVFPGNWNASQPTAAGEKLQARLASAGKEAADFWAGLGYDFARLSANLGIREGWAPQTVNGALQSASLSWSIAPISWSNGIASQKMHLFAPAENGFAPVNEQAFRTAFEEAWR